MQVGSRLFAGVVAVGLLIGPATATAAEWWYVTDANDRVIFADRSSVVKIQLNGKGLVRAWTSTFYFRVNSDGAIASKDMWYFDCADRALAPKSWIDYKTDKSVRLSSTIADYNIKMGPTAPETVGEAMMLFACNADDGSGDVSTFEAEGMAFYWVEDPEKTVKALTPNLPKSAPATPAKRAK